MNKQKSDLYNNFFNSRLAMETFRWGDYNLDVSQERILRYIISGKSLFLTGAAGTGKSLLLRHIIYVLQIAYPEQHQVAITAPTGIASFPLGGYTLHSWAGLEPNSTNYPVDEIVKSIRSRKHLLRHWQKVKVLIIDEVSLVSPILLEKLDGVARSIRKVDKPMGGIQVVACGDFLQLPPVGNDGTGYRFCFEHPIWKALFENNTYCLQRVYRSIDDEWTQVLEELRTGELTAETRVLLKSRVKPINSTELEGIRLFPRRKQVDEWNQQRLSELPGEEYIWNATEVGDDYDRDILDRCCLAPRRLILKVGSPVLLLKNLDQNAGLINGRQGIVEEFVVSKNSNGNTTPGDQIIPGYHWLPVVRFGNKLINMEPAEWNYKNGYQVRATRTQFPLLLADSISTHKAQGMTLDHAVVDLRGIFEDGQAYVGLSRVRSLDGLTCLGVIPFQVIRADKKAVSYWKEIKGREPDDLKFIETLPWYLWVGWRGEYDNKEVMVFPPDEGIWRVWVIGTEEVIQGELTTEEWIQWSRVMGKEKKQFDMRIWCKPARV